MLLVIVHHFTTNTKKKSRAKCYIGGMSCFVRSGYIQVNEVVRLRGCVKGWEGQEGSICRQVRKEKHKQGSKNPTKQTNHTQVQECIEKISALETEIGDAGMMRLVLFC